MNSLKTSCGIHDACAAPCWYLFFVANLKTSNQITCAQSLHSLPNGRGCMSDNHHPISELTYVFAGQKTHIISVFNVPTGTGHNITI